MLADMSILWRSHKTQQMTTSTMMEECLAIYNATCHKMLIALVDGHKGVNIISVENLLLLVISFSNIKIV